MIDPMLVPPLQDVLLVARTGSVVAAARRLHKTSSAVSQQIRRVETHFGIRLFERRGRGVTLSPQGDVAIGAVSRLFDEAEAAYGVLANLSATPTTVLQVAASDYLGRRLILPVLRRLLAESVPLRFEITTAHSPAARRAAELGEVDLALVTSSEERTPLTGRRLCEQPFYWVAPRAPARGSIADRLGREPLLRLSAGSEGRRILDGYLERHRIQPISTIDVPSVILMLSYVRAGLGLGLAPALSLGAGRGRMAVERARVAPRPVKLVMRDRWRPTPVAERFIESLATEATRAIARVPAP